MRFDHLYTQKMGSEYISRTLKNGVRVHFFRVFLLSNPTTTPSDTAALLITHHAMSFINKVL